MASINGAKSVKDLPLQSGKGAFLDGDRFDASPWHLLSRLRNAWRMTAQPTGTPARGTPRGGQTIVPAMTTFEWRGTPARGIPTKGKVRAPVVSNRSGGAVSECDALLERRDHAAYDTPVKGGERFELLVVLDVEYGRWRRLVAPHSRLVCGSPLPLLDEGPPLHGPVGRKDARVSKRRMEEGT